MFSVDNYPVINTLVNLIGNNSLKPETDTLNLFLECETPQQWSTLRRKYGDECAKHARENNFILPQEQLWQHFNLKIAEIEINRHCNWSCVYCPNASNKTVHEYMSMDVYKEIIKKVKRCKTIKFITFNFYNEPTIDIHFEERIAFLKNSGLKLIIHTNGSGLTPKRLMLLKESNLLETIKFNLPAVDEKTFINMTGYHGYKKVIRNIQNALNMGFNISFVVNGLNNESTRNAIEIQQYFKIDHNQIDKGKTTWRAGAVKGWKEKSIYIPGKLPGCSNVITFLTIGIDGECYLCCMDYFKKYSIGNILNMEIYEIMQSEKAVNIRKKVCGYLESDPNFLCRKCEHMQWMALYKRLLRNINK